MQSKQGVAGGFLFRAFEAETLGNKTPPVGQKQTHLKQLGVFRSPAGMQRVQRPFTICLLDDFLKLRLKILLELPCRRPGPVFREKAPHKLLRGHKTSVFIHCPKQRLKGVRQQGLALTPALILLSPAQAQMPVKAYGTRHSSQGRRIHQMGTQAGQISLLCMGKATKKLAGDAQRQNRIPQKLQTFVMPVAAIRFIGKGAVGQRRDKQSPIPKKIAKFPFKALQCQCRARHISIPACSDAIYVKQIPGESKRFALTESGGAPT